MMWRQMLQLHFRVSSEKGVLYQMQSWENKTSEQAQLES